MVIDSLEAYLATLTSMEYSDVVLADTARALAIKIDSLQHNERATAAMALPALTRELREVLEAIRGDDDGSQEFVADLFAPVGDSA